MKIIHFYGFYFGNYIYLLLKYVIATVTIVITIRMRTCKKQIADEMKILTKKHFRFRQKQNFSVKSIL